MDYQKFLTLLQQNNYAELEKSVLNLVLLLDTNEYIVTKEYNSIIFYIGYGFKKLGNNKKAIEYLEKRLLLGGDSQELYISALSLARIVTDQPSKRRSYLLQCISFDSQRLEAFYELLTDDYINKQYRDSVSWAIKAPNTREYSRHIFADKFIYDYHFDFQISVIAYYAALKKDNGYEDIGLYLLGLDAIDRCFRNLPPNLQKLTISNTKFYTDKLPSAYSIYKPPVVLWEEALEKIPNPPLEKCTWSTDSNRKLSIVLIEFRSHKWMDAVIKNNTWLYGNQNVGLTIVHGRGNKEFVQNLTQNHTGVHYVEYPVDNISWCQYSEYLTDYNFYDKLIGEFILVIQCDTISLEKIDEKYYQFDYIGAPWKWTINMSNEAFQGPFNHRQVGNGGYSLRKRSVMRDLCYKYKDVDKKTEDTFFSSCVPSDRFPDFEKAQEFGVEAIYYPNPYGLHKCYDYLDKNQLIQLLSLLPLVYSN